MRWKKSFLVGLVTRQQDKWDRDEEGEIISNKPDNIFDEIGCVIVGTLWVILVIYVLLLAQFIEAPIRMLIFKGKLKDKVLYWLRCWRSAWRGVYQGCKG